MMAVAVDYWHTSCACGSPKGLKASKCLTCRTAERQLKLYSSPCLGHHPAFTVAGETPRTRCQLSVDFGGLPHRHCFCLEPVAAYWQGRCGQCVAEAMGLGRIVSGQGGTPEPLW